MRVQFPSKHLKAAVAATILLAAQLSFSAEWQVPPDLNLIGVEALYEDFQNFTVFDARPTALWREGRIPGALSLDWEDLTRTDANGVEYRLLPLATLAEVLAEKGIDEQTPVVIYGDIENSWGAEGWACWLFSYLGHQGPVRLLEGGFEAWRQADHPIDRGAESIVPKATAYRLQPREELAWTPSKEFVHKQDVVLIDVRTFSERFRGGIPGAIALSWRNLYAGNPPKPLPPERYIALLRRSGIDHTKHLVFYCTGGIRSGFVWTVDRLSGRQGHASNYEGGTAHFSKNK